MMKGTPGAAGKNEGDKRPLILFCKGVMKPYWQRYNDLKRAVYLRDGGCCQLCNRSVKRGEYEIDHIVPRYLGGQNHAENLRVLCIRCHALNSAEQAHQRAHERRFNPNYDRANKRFVTGGNPTRPRARQNQRHSIIAPPPPYAQRNTTAMGLNLNELYPSKWLKADEFEEGEQRVLTIADVRLEAVGKPGANQEDKPVLYFEDDKPMVLNKTNAHIVGKLYGMDTDAWIGQRVTVFAMDVDSFGEIVRALRIRPTVPVGRPVQHPRHAAPQAPHNPQYAAQQPQGARPQRQVQPVATMPNAAEWDGADDSDPFSDN